MGDIDHGHNCPCICCPCLLHKGCQSCDKSGSQLDNHMQLATEYHENFRSNSTTAHKSTKPYGQRLEEIIPTPLKFNWTTESRDMFKNYTTIVPERVQPPKTPRTYTPNNDKFYSATTQKHDYPGFKPTVRPLRQRDSYDMTKPDALAFLTTTKSDFRDFYDTQHGGKVVKEKPDFFTVLKEAELKFQANSSHRADFLNWNSTNGGYDRPKSQRQKKDFFSKAEEDRDFVTTTASHFYGMTPKKNSSA